MELIGLALFLVVCLWIVNWSLNVWIDVLQSVPGRLRRVLKFLKEL